MFPILGSHPLTHLQRSTHAYVVGQTGTGKSRALESWVMQDIAAGNGVGVIDPHGDLFQRLLFRLADMPSEWERTVVIDIFNQKWAVGVDPLACQEGFPVERTALFLTDIMMKIWKLEVAQSPRLVWLLTNTFTALSDLGLSLLDLPRFLTDRIFRDQLLPNLKLPHVREFFEYEFPKTDRGVHQWITPVLNKLGGLLFDPDIRPMLSADASLDFREIMDKKRILLVNLPKGLIGEQTSALLGAFVVARVQKAALSRANDSRRVPFYLYLDEFQNYTTDNITDILSESRKYRLSLTLANQYLEQLPTDIRNAVLNNAGTLMCFRVGYRDAAALAKEIFPSPGFMHIPDRRVDFRNILGLPAISIRNQRKPLGWDGLALKLTKLRMREFWCRRRWHPLPTKHRTWDVPDPVITSDLRSKLNSLLDESGRRYARLKGHVAEGTPNSSTSSSACPNAHQPAEQQTQIGDDIPFWGR